jgi:hypothetical protein
VKTESATTDDWERSAHCIQWAVVLAFPRIAAQLGQPPPVELIRRLLDVFVVYTAGSMKSMGPMGRVDNDPTGGFRRAHLAAVSLRKALEGWNGEPPMPPVVAEAARDMVTAYGHPAAGRWDEHTVSGEVRESLLWPDENPT